MKKVFTFLFALFAASQFATAFELPSNCKQVLVGVADSWNSSYVKLTLYEKKFGNWKAVSKTWSGRLGKSGLAWGRGLHPVPQGAATKKEGDRRAPAGVFDMAVGAWGYAAPGTYSHKRALPYRQITTRDLWFEDVNSPYYNNWMRLNHEPRTESERKAQMKQNDYAHSLKLFIAHNFRPAVPGQGSSIFFHIWRNGGGSPTAGCTTMDKKNLEYLISEVDPGKTPLYVLLPKAEYAQYRATWKLP